MQAVDGQVLQISRTWTDLTGYALTDVPTEETWLTRAYGPGADAVREHMHELFKGQRRTLDVEFAIRARKGEDRHWSFSASAPGRLLDGRRYLVGMAVDVTDRRRAEAALRASEERLHRMVNVPGVGVLVFDVATGTLIDANDAFLAMSGYSREQVLRKELTWQAMTPPEYHEESRRQMALLAETGRLGPYEKEYICSDGRRSPMLFAGASLGEGSVVEYCIDLRLAQQAQSALRESEERFRLLVEGTRDFAMLMLDPDNRILAWNIGAERLLGFTEAEAVGQRGAIIFTPEDRAAQAPEQEVLQARSAGRAVDERWHLRKDGTRFWGSGVMTALHHPDGSIRGFVKVLRDETARRQVEQAELEARRAAEAANQMKDEFLATLSHELRTPLSSILLWSKMLHPGAAPALLEEGLSAIRNSADAQKQLIDDLLDTSRITSGKLRLEMRPVDLAAVTKETFDSMLPTAEVRGVAMSAEIAADVGIVRADPDRVRQVLWNLLGNAVKFTSAGGTVNVRLQRCGSGGGRSNCG
jgi:PAS domain S-box-containing protein